MVPSADPNYFYSINQNFNCCPMSIAIHQKNFIQFRYGGEKLQAAYSFSESFVSRGAKTTTNVSMDLSFMLPARQEAMLLSVVKSALILAQPRATIEAIVQDEITRFLSNYGYPVQWTAQPPMTMIA